MISRILRIDYNYPASILTRKNLLTIWISVVDGILVAVGVEGKISQIENTTATW